MKVNLEGRVTLVTGAARGIGQATVDALSANGVGVIRADIDIAAPPQAGARPAGALALPADVTDA